MKWKFKTKPWEHQLKALSYLKDKNCAALYTDMGTGKTKIMIDLMRNRPDMRRVLIVAPLKACKVWRDEIEKHGVASKFNVLYLCDMKIVKKVHEIDTRMQWKRLDTTPEDVTTVIILNYEVVWREPIGSKLLTKNVGIDTVMCDESHRIKSPSSKCSRYLAKIGSRVKNRFLITGTPIAENPMDVYAQYRFCDPTIYGTNYASFCERYQNVDIKKTQKVGYTCLVEGQPYKNLDELKEKMFSIAFVAESTVKLPKRYSKTVRFPLGNKVSTMYKELVKEGILELEDGFVDVDAVIARIIREQQLTSGFLPVEDEDGNVTITQVSKRRMECFKRILKKIGGEPVVVFCKYKKDIANVHEACKDVGVTSSELSGSHDTLKEWMDGETDVLVIQYSSGAESLTLTRARHTVYYSLTHSYAQYKQSKKRTHRPSQTRECYLWNIVGTMEKGKTIDEKIMEALASKQDIADYLMNRKDE